MKWFDLPPIWLALFAGLAWAQSKWFNLGLSFGSFYANWAGAMLIGLGLLLIAFAIYELLRFRTTPIPHMQPSHLVTTGVFRLSRNPIYLADALILLGLILRWDAVISLPLVPVLIWVIQKRFILSEEARLDNMFGAKFRHYCSNTRRWI